MIGRKRQEVQNLICKTEMKGQRLQRRSAAFEAICRAIPAHCKRALLKLRQSSVSIALTIIPSTALTERKGACCKIMLNARQE